MKTYRFKNLDVWLKSIDIIKLVYKIIETFPDSEKYALSDQLKRAAISISLNIAEGSGSGTDPEFGRFLNMSKRSAYEVLAALEIAKELNMGDKLLLADASDKIDELSAMLSGLIHVVTKKAAG